MNNAATNKSRALKKPQKQQARKAAINTLAWLAKTFPEAFDTEHRVRPLKIGILQDIFDYMQENNISEVSKSKVRQALVMFTRRMEYLVCLKVREPRVDLEGHSMDPVSEEDALQAAQKIKKQVEKRIREKHSEKTSKPQTTTSGVKELKSVAKVTVKRKIDPEAVARIKAKLGIGSTEKESA